ncbi:MAG TPA: NADH oxidase, partial [Turneriella sp.]|nr:NADH oxidase [Turneriella sp.]
EGVDMIEISGGTYESAVMTGVGGVRESTAEREAYFLPFAAKIRLAIKIPIMLTGGFRSAHAMNAAIESGTVDIVGMARPLAMEPHLCVRLLADTNARSEIQPVKTGIRFVDKLGVLELGYYGLQLARIGEGKHPDPNISPLLALPLIGLNYSSGIIGRWLSGKAAD